MTLIGINGTIRTALRVMIPASGLLASTLFARQARALPFCDDASINPPFTSALVVQSGDTQEPMLRLMSQKLRNSTAQQRSLLYTTTGTCTIIANMYNADPAKRVLAAGSTLSYAPSTLENPAWDASQPPAQCIVNPAAYPNGIPIDIGIAATYTSSCTASAPPADVGLFPGPVAGYGFIVPKASTQQSLTAEQGYFVFGFGNIGKATPWVDEQFIFTRTATKSTALTLSAAVGVSPVTKLRGTPFNGSTEVLNSVAQSTNPEKTIGLMGTEIYDQNRDKVTELAFRAFGQRYAFLPDSSPTSFDKKNLRDGHYTPWAQTIYITAIDAGTKLPTNANAQLLIDLVLGNKSLPDVDGLGVIVSKGLVPFCAMKVNRDPVDAAPLKGYTNPAPCGCFFEAKVPNGKTSCTACTTDAPCGTGKCRHNFCEAQ
jgi:hypothetical protein